MKYMATSIDNNHDVNLISPIQEGQIHFPCCCVHQASFIEQFFCYITLRNTCQLMYDVVHAMEKTNKRKANSWRLERRSRKTGKEKRKIRAPSTARTQVLLSLKKNPKDILSRDLFRRRPICHVESPSTIHVNLAFKRSNALCDIFLKELIKKILHYGH